MKIGLTRMAFHSLYIKDTYYLRQFNSFSQDFLDKDLSRISIADVFLRTLFVLFI